MDQPNLILLAGPNGSGKSTAAPDLLRGAFHVEEFVNADVIARGLSAFHPEGAAIEAGRVMLARLRELTALRRNVAFETTLASKTFVPWIKSLRSEGYAFHLFYLWLRSPDACVKRVGERRSLGGHLVPEQTIRRRYAAGLRNFFNLYASIAESWHFFDNTNAPRRLVAAGGVCLPEHVEDRALWDKIKRDYGNI
jgi:predicted ABC-type ATPase